VAATQDLPLGSEFPTPSRQDWLALVDKVLAGKSFERTLVSRTYDGLDLQPLYTAEDAPPPDSGGVPGLPPHTRGGSAARRIVDGWDIRQLHQGTDSAAVNAAILADLAGGVTSILLGPLPDLGRALEGVLLDLAPICLDWGAEGQRGAEELLQLWDRADIPPSASIGELGLDPLGVAARAGTPPSLQPAVPFALRIAESRPNVRSLRVDARLYAEAGAADAQELAFALATGLAYVRALVESGADVGQALGQLSFSLAATPDQFATMAKLRAARRCWSRLAESCGAAEGDKRMALTAVTSLAHYSQRDPWVNPLRATLACFAAAVAGADAITVLPMGAAAGVWDEDGRRLARNTQTILLEECGLARVADPGAGSYYVDRFSEELAVRAWSLFQAIEGRGGMTAVLADGWASEQVEATWSARLRNLALRRDALTGVSEFANAGEVPLAGGEPAGAERSNGPFPLRRLAAPFEALRDAADVAADRPRIFLANLGPLAEHTARTGFARNLFEVAGMGIVDGPDASSPAEVAEAFRASGAPLTVLCSSDAVYAEMAEDAARALKDAGARRIYLAGNPGDHRAAYEQAGVDEFVHIGSDVLAVLQGALETCGVAVR
jgi:methylmalonyl-CoA mutase